MFLHNLGHLQRNGFLLQSVMAIVDNLIIQAYNPTAIWRMLWMYMGIYAETRTLQKSASKLLPVPSKMQSFSQCIPSKTLILNTDTVICSRCSAFRNQNPEGQNVLQETLAVSPEIQTCPETKEHKGCLATFIKCGRGITEVWKKKKEFPKLFFKHVFEGYKYCVAKDNINVYNSL